MVLSLTGVKEGLRGHVVVEMSDLDNEPLVKLVGGELIETVVAHDVIGRLMIQCALQPGLAQVSLISFYYISQKIGCFGYIICKLQLCQKSLTNPSVYVLVLIAFYCSIAFVNCSVHFLLARYGRTYWGLRMMSFTSKDGLNWMVSVLKMCLSHFLMRFPVELRLLQMVGR